MQVDRTSLSVAQRRNFMAYQLRNLRDLSYGSPPPPRAKTALAVRVNESRAKGKVPPPKSAAGFLLLDWVLNPVCLNTDAMQILCYPDKFVTDGHPSLFIAGKIRSTLISQQSSGESPFVTEFRSGRRHYFCRTFLVDSNSRDTSHPSVAVLLERGPSELASLSQVSQRFNLTQREQEALEYLLQGLSSKEIANRMNISPNTVKAFLRLIMIKTGVSSRTAIPWKIIRGRACRNDISVGLALAGHSR